MNPSTGAILALASYPTFDPNVLATLDGTQLNKIDNQLLHRPEPAAAEPGHPGDLSARLDVQDRDELGRVLAPARWPAPAAPSRRPPPLRLPNGNHLVNDSGEICGNGNPPIIQAFWMSCNTAFGGLGIKLTAPVLRQYSSQFGMNRPLSIPLPVAPSVVPESRGLDRPVADRLHRDRSVQRRR